MRLEPRSVSLLFNEQKSCWEDYGLFHYRTASDGLVDVNQGRLVCCFFLRSFCKVSDSEYSRRAATKTANTVRIGQRFGTKPRVEGGCRMKILAEKPSQAERSLYFELTSADMLDAG